MRVVTVLLAVGLTVESAVVWWRTFRHGVDSLQDLGEGVLFSAFFIFCIAVPVLGLMAIVIAVDRRAEDAWGLAVSAVVINLACTGHFVWSTVTSTRVLSLFNLLALAVCQTVIIVLTAILVVPSISEARRP